MQINIRHEIFIDNLSTIIRSLDSGQKMVS
jgi:hypothetical protein